MSVPVSHGSEGTLPAPDVALIRKAEWRGTHPAESFRLPDYVYPGLRPLGSFVLRDGLVSGVDVADEGFVERDTGASVDLAGKVLVLAYGSNADPHKLATKLDGFEVVALRCIIIDHVAVWTTGTRGDGSRVATIAKSSGVYELHHVLALPPEALPAVDEWEGAHLPSPFYRRESCDYVVLENGAVPEDCLVYVGDAARDRGPLLLDGSVARVAEWPQRAIDELRVSLTSSPAVFVYGTLMPGRSRWHCLAPFAVDEGRPATIDGALWDTGWGWPALTRGTGSVDGVIVPLREGDTEAALATLDAIEGCADGLFVRDEVVTREGECCWVYRWPGSTDGFNRLGRSWSQ